MKSILYRALTMIGLFDVCLTIVIDTPYCSEQFTTFFNSMRPLKLKR